MIRRAASVSFTLMSIPRSGKVAQLIAAAFVFALLLPTSVANATTLDSADEVYVVGGHQLTGGEAVVTAPSASGKDGFSVNGVVIPELRIVNSWLDHRARRVHLRAAAADKIRIRHNVTDGLARITTQYPDSSFAGSGSSWIYNTTVKRYVGGRLEDSVVMKTVVEFGNRQADSLPYGLVTSYCLGMVRCPDWTARIIGG